MSLGRNLLVREFSQDVEAVERLNPSDPKEIVSETLVETLNIATITNLSMRFDGSVADVLPAFRRVTRACFGSRMWMGCSWILWNFFRPHRKDRKETETRQSNDTQIRFSDDATLTRNQKAGVKPLTYFSTHWNNLMVLVGGADLGAVMA